MDQAKKQITKNFLYKTSLCKNFLEHGYCRYNDKCQFAHGQSDQRHLLKHKKRKQKSPEAELPQTGFILGPFDPARTQQLSSSSLSSSSSSSSLLSVSSADIGVSPPHFAMGSSPTSSDGGSLSNGVCQALSPQEVYLSRCNERFLVPAYNPLTCGSSLEAPTSQTIPPAVFPHASQSQAFSQFPFFNAPSSLIPEQPKMQQQQQYTPLSFLPTYHDEYSESFGPCPWFFPPERPVGPLLSSTLIPQYEAMSASYIC